MKTLRTVGALIAISGIAALSRSILSADRRSIKGFLRGWVLAGFVGIVVGAIMKGQGYTPETMGGVVGIAAFIADDILLFLITIASTLRNNPQQIIDWLLRRNSP